MTTRDTIRILIKHAAQDVAGQGCGLCVPLSETDRDKVREAVRKVFCTANGRDPDKTDLYNLGL